MLSGSIGLHPHFHLNAVDGVFVRDTPNATPRLVQAPPPTPELLADVVARVDKRVHRWLKRHGYAHQTPVEERSNELPEDDPLTSCLRVASAQGTFATLLDPPAAGAAGREEEHFDTRAAPRKSKWVATHDGFNLHAGVTVAAGHRTFLERRGSTGPPFCATDWR